MLSELDDSIVSEEIAIGPASLHNLFATITYDTATQRLSVILRSFQTTDIQEQILCSTLR